MVKARGTRDARYLLIRSASNNIQHNTKNGPVPMWMIFLLKWLSTQPRWARKSFRRSQAKATTNVIISANRLLVNIDIPLSCQ
jgi:hypothetical protein